MSVKGSLDAIVEIARKEIGTIEGPKDNETKYGKWTGANFQPWCQSFVSWCAFTSGLDAKKYPKTASTVAAADWFKKNNRWADARNDDPTPGDWIFFDFPDDGVNRISHVGLCVKNNKDGTIQVIEGNTSGTAKGDQRNGGMCVEKTRAYVKNKKGILNAVVGWGRPVYTGEENAPLLSKAGVVTEAAAPAAKTKKVAPAAFKPLKNGSKGAGVKTVQTLLGIKADGSFGPGTAKAVQDFQKKSGLPTTGVVDQSTLKALKAK
jgi:peptidoglycan hydrolase-like protein with peptidoglycan-binding domain